MEEKKKLRFWGIEREIEIVIVVDEEPVFEDSQKKACTEVFNNVDKFIRETELSVYNYYMSIYKELREQFIFNTNEYAPIVNNESEFAKLVTPTQIMFKETFGQNKTKFGVLFNCTWDKSHGLAVVFENGKIKEVGEQDIIL